MNCDLFFEGGGGADLFLPGKIAAFFKVRGYLRTLFFALYYMRPDTAELKISFVSVHVMPSVISDCYSSLAYL